VEDPSQAVSPQPTNDRREELPAWIRHVIYWVVALGVISLSAFDGSVHPANSFGVEELVFLIAVFIGFSALVINKLEVTLREWDQVSVARTISRSLVAFTFALGIVAGVLVLNRRWVHIEACRTVGGLETCRGPASPQQVLGMLAWHAANVVPVLDIPHSLEWQRPARSANAFVGASILVVRLWVAIGILVVLKRVWDRWGPGGPGQRFHIQPTLLTWPGVRRAGLPRQSPPLTPSHRRRRRRLDPVRPNSAAHRGITGASLSRPRRQLNSRPSAFRRMCESTRVHRRPPEQARRRARASWRPRSFPRITAVVSNALARSESAVPGSANAT
jgi:hypothetical protein